MQTDGQGGLARKRTGSMLAATFALLLVGVLLGRSISGGGPANAAEPDVDATATRTAELREISALKTAVAQKCTPEATPSPTPTVEPTATATPAAMRTDLAYDDQWVIVVTSFSPVLPSGDPKPAGQFLKLTLTLTNNGDTALPPLTDLRLVDASGTSNTVDIKATNALVGENWMTPVKGGQSEDRAMIFDVPLDAGTSFTLVSKSHPEFRVAVAIEARG